MTGRSSRTRLGGKRGAGQFERRQHALDLAARGLEPRRQDERLAEMRGILVDGEPRTKRRDLEEHAAGFLEVDRLEPEAIDYLGRMPAGAFHLRADEQFFVEIRHRPRKMMHRADAPRAAPLVRRLADVDDAGRVGEAVARPLAFARDLVKAERGLHERRSWRLFALPDLRAIEAANLPRFRNRAALPRRERPRLPSRAFREREAHAVRVDNRQHGVAE